MSLVGKKFTKRMAIEVVEELKHHLIIKNVNNDSDLWEIPKEQFEANYVEVVNDGGDMAVSNDKTNTKEETK